jgi:predicted dehydrogenase
MAVPAHSVEELARRSRGRMELEDASKAYSIRREVGLKENVMVDTRNMSAAHVQELKEAVANGALGDKRSESSRQR